MDHKLIFARGSDRIELEGPVEWVEKQFSKLHKLLNEPCTDSSATVANDTLVQGAPTTSNGQRLTLKAFVEAKTPRNIYESMACVLYHASKYSEHQEMSAEEIRQALIKAGVRPPKQLLQALVDCRRRYGYIEGGTQRGMWKLSNDGEVTVELDLPPKK